MSLNFYCKEEDNSREESINKYQNLFSNYDKNPPSLKEALNQMFKSSDLNNIKINELTEDLLSRCKEKIDPKYDEIKGKYNNISKEDAYIICSYTCESEERQYSPYRILNQSLVSDDRQRSVRNVSKYLYIFLKSLRKLPRYYPKNKYLYRCLTCKVNLSKDPNNEKLVPYIAGNLKTFWGFTSTSPDPKMTYSFLKNEEKNKSGTIFTLGGDIWGYNIELFNYYNEKEILLEPERKLKVDSVLPPVNDIINITCTILKTPLIIDNNEFDLNYYNDVEDDININLVNIGEIMNKYIIKFEVEANIDEKVEFRSGIGVICNIPSKRMKALITFNHLINLSFLNQSKKLILYINNKEREIDMKKNRYKYANKELDFAIIEILEKDGVENFIGVDKFINSRNFIGTDIKCFSLINDKDVEMLNGIIKEKNNNNYICTIDSKNEGIIMLKDNCKLIGLMKENKEIIPINIIINKINFIKCIYYINNEDKDEYIQIINYKDKNGFIKNPEIENEIKLMIDGELKSNTLKYKFNKEGIQNIYLISYNHLTNMSFLFCDCTSLKEIDLESFDTSKVTDMSYMLYNCFSLKKINILSFNTSQVTNMSFMFYNCSLLKEINLSSFNTGKVTDMLSMFENCSSLNELNLTSFNTNNVEDMSYMFYGCSSLKELNLTSFNVEQVNNFSRMFHNCSSLTELNLHSFKNNNAKDMSGMFYNCSSIKNLFLTEFKVYNVTNMSYMFYNCSSLKTLYFVVSYTSYKTTDNVTDMSCMFYNCSSLKELDLKSFNTSKVKNMSCMFYNCSSLEELNLSSFDTEQVENMSSMFNKCSSLKKLELRTFYTNKEVNTLYMFNSINKNCNIKCRDKNILKELKEFKKNEFSIAALLRLIIIIMIIYKIFKKIFY